MSLERDPNYISEAELKRMERAARRIDRGMAVADGYAATRGSLADARAEADTLEGSDGEAYGGSKRRAGLAPAGTFNPWRRDGDHFTPAAPLATPGATRYRALERAETRHRWRDPYVPSVPADDGDEVTLNRTRWYELPGETLESWAPRTSGASRLATLPESRTQTPHGVTTSPDIAALELPPPWESYLVRVPDLPRGEELSQGQAELVELIEERAGGANFGRTATGWVDDDGETRGTTRALNVESSPTAIYGPKGGWHMALNEPTGFPAGREAVESIPEETRFELQWTREDFEAVATLRTGGRTRTSDEERERLRLACDVAAYLDASGDGGMKRLRDAYGVSAPTLRKLRREGTG